MNKKPTQLFPNELHEAFLEKSTPASGVSAIIGSTATTDALQPVKLFPPDFDIALQPTEKLAPVPFHQTKGNNTLAHLNADMHYSGIMVLARVDEENRHGLFQVISCTQYTDQLDVFVRITFFDPIIGLFERDLPWWTCFSLFLGQP